MAYVSTASGVDDTTNVSSVTAWAGLWTTIWNRTVSGATTVATSAANTTSDATAAVTAATVSSLNSSSWQLSQSLVVLGADAERVRFVATLSGSGGFNGSVSLDDVHFDSDCTECPKGTYKDFYGSDFCGDCDRGSYCETTGLLAPTAVCSPGKYSGFGQALCTSCEGGRYQINMESWNCTACDPGMYGPTTGATSCTTPCPVGRYSEGGEEVRRVL